MHESAWDVFIAHAKLDAADAEHLYDLLRDSCRVFLDSRTLRLGDDWDVELPLAQQASLMTVVLVSAHTNRAFYQREEIARAVAMARDDNQSHRVIPLYLGEMSTDVPYGLRVKHGMVVEDIAGLEIAASRILELVGELESSVASIGAVVPATTPTKQSLEDPLEQTRRRLDEQGRASEQKTQDIVAKARELLNRTRRT